MNIRKAEKKDLNSWASMRNTLWPDRIDIHTAELEAYFSGSSIDIVECFVSENDSGQMLGFIELNIRNFAEGSRSPRIPYVEGWFIAAPHRHKGYGIALMKQAEVWALKQGYQELASDTEIDNLKSIVIHKKLGFKETERVVCFLKKLRPDTQKTRGFLTPVKQSDSSRQ